MDNRITGASPFSPEELGGILTGYDWKAVNDQVYGASSFSTEGGTSGVAAICVVWWLDSERSLTLPSVHVVQAYSISPLKKKSSSLVLSYTHHLPSRSRDGRKCILRKTCVFRKIGRLWEWKNKVNAGLYGLEV